jgi:hypothetical protein
VTYPKQTREWQGVTLDDISNQWQKSKDVHPSFGRQLSHFAARIDSLLKERNYVAINGGQININSTGSHCDPDFD